MKTKVDYGRIEKAEINANNLREAHKLAAQRPEIKINKTQIFRGSSLKYTRYKANSNFKIDSADITNISILIFTLNSETEL